MDLETENRIAALLMREAAELRRQAQQEGVLAYLNKPTVRGRPNSRFLTATVRGIQQANRAVEVNEMWRVRQKEVELVERLRCRSRDERSYSSRETGRGESQSRKRGHDRDTPCSSSRKDERIHVSRDSDVEDSHNRDKRHSSDTPCLSSKRSYEDHDSRDDISLKDEEIDQFLHSRVKRGRGSIGSRMDEAGPYLPRSLESAGGLFANGDPVKDERHRSVIGPEKPSFLKPCESSDDDSDDDWRKRSKKSSSGGARKDCSKKRKSKVKSRDKKRKKEKRLKH